MISEIKMMDCIEGMKQYPDKFFDLAIVDPPYGIDVKSFGNGSRSKIYDRSLKNNWDSQVPNDDYFTELFRVSKNQIIWGSNYFNLPPTKCFIVWDKKQNEKVSFAMAELAWSSFKSKSMVYYGSPKSGQRIHPTQKPIALYEWLLKNYAKEGNKILDTHLGSGSSRIAAYKLGFDFWGFEIDEDYYKAQEKRFKESISMPLFDTPSVVAEKLVLQL